MSLASKGVETQTVGDETLEIFQVVGRELSVGNNCGGGNHAVRMGTPTATGYIEKEMFFSAISESKLPTKAPSAVLTVCIASSSTAHCKIPTMLS